MTEASIEIIAAALTVEVFAFSPDGDPLAMVIISEAEAMRLVSLPPMMGHVFRAARESGGRVFVEAVEALDPAGAHPAIKTRWRPIAVDISRLGGPSLSVDTDGSHPRAFNGMVVAPFSPVRTVLEERLFPEALDAIASSIGSGTTVAWPVVNRSVAKAVVRRIVDRVEIAGKEVSGTYRGYRFGLVLGRN